MAVLNNQINGNQVAVRSNNDIFGDNRAPMMQLAVLQPRYISRTGDPTLVRLEQDLNASVGKPSKQNEMLDSWLDLMERAKEEDYYEKKYWAFLNGYLNIKMA